MIAKVKAEEGVYKSEKTQTKKILGNTWKRAHLLAEFGRN
jgi:hypothetical protein